MNRGIMEWAMLYLGVANLLIGVIGLGHVPIFFTLLIFFMAGMCFDFWIIGGYINTYKSLLERLLNFCVKLIDGKREILEKVKGSRVNKGKLKRCRTTSRTIKR